MSDVKVVNGLPELKMIYPEPPELKEEENIFLFLTDIGKPVLDLAVSCMATVAGRRGSWGYISENEFVKVSQDGTLRVADASVVVDALPILQKHGLLKLLKNKADGLVYIEPSVELADMVNRSMHCVI